MVISRLARLSATLLVTLSIACGPRDAPPPEVKLTETPASGEPGEPGEATLDLLQTLEEDGNFTVLLRAIETADSVPLSADDVTLAQMLQSDSRYTLFAPSDEAWAKVPGDRQEELFDHPRELRALILHHMVPGVVTADDLRQLTERPDPGDQPALDTVLGTRVGVTVGGGGTIIYGGARVEKANQAATNGMIHHISLVMTAPPDATTG